MAVYGKRKHFFTVKKGGRTISSHRRQFLAEEKARKVGGMVLVQFKYGGKTYTEKTYKPR